MLFKNKKATERYMSPWMFFIWTLIAAAIFAGVMIFYSTEGDVRGTETGILNLKILNCIVDNGQISEEFFNSEFDIFKKCSLSKEVLDSSRDFYFNISVSGDRKKEILAGEKDFEIQCGLSGKNFAVCSRTKINVLDKDNKQLVLEVFTGSNNLGRKV